MGFAGCYANNIASNLINQAIHLVDLARPKASKFVLQRLWKTKPVKRIAANLVNKTKYFFNGFGIAFRPLFQFAERAAFEHYLHYLKRRAIKFDKVFPFTNIGNRFEQSLTGIRIGKEIFRLVHFRFPNDDLDFPVSEKTLDFFKEAWIELVTEKPKGCRGCHTKIKRYRME